MRESRGVLETFFQEEHVGSCLPERAEHQVDVDCFRVFFTFSHDLWLILS